MKCFPAFFNILLFLSMSVPAYSQSTNLKVYGYFDFEAEVSNKDRAGKNWTFDQHHVNFLAIYHLDDHFRVFTETEWEHGPSQDSVIVTGRIYLARGFLEYQYSDAFKLQAGKMLTPFGIYNARHDATPTFLSTVLPMSIYGKHLSVFEGNQRVYSQLITGLKVSGNVFVNKWQGEYHLYVANGRGPRPGEQDNNANKAVGGRITLRSPEEEVKIGVSYFNEKNGNAKNTIHKTLGLDMELDFAALHLESEVFFPRLEEIGGNGNPNGNFEKVFGYYFMGAYSFFDKLTPFARYDYFDLDRRKILDANTDVVLGINFSVTPKVYLKSEVHFIRFEDKTLIDYELFVSSVAVAF